MPFSPKNTLAVFLLVIAYIFAMYLMSDVFDIPSYREDDHIQSKDHSELSNKKEEHSEPLSDHEQISTKLHDSTTLVSQPRDTATEAHQTSVEVENNVIDQQEPKGISDREYFEQLIENYQEEVLSVIPETENRTDIVVRYYDHASDEGKAEILKNYRYYLHLRETAENLDKYESNSLFYGDSVSTRDIQLVAYLLITNGIPIRQIIPSQFHDGWKSRAIEIGTDLDMSTAPVLDLSEVRSFKNSFYEINLNK